MNKFKKLVPAICMLLVSAVLMGTSTYAWFSMNTSVKANNLGVTAKSNAQYLLIATSDNATNKENSDIKVDETGVAELYPVTFYKEAKAESVIGNKTLADFVGENASTWYGNNKWFTANNKNTDSATDDVRNVKLLVETNTTEFAKYVKTFTYYLTLSDVSEPFSGHLKLTLTAATSVTNNEVATTKTTAVKTVVKITDGATVTYVALSNDKLTDVTTSITLNSTKSVKAEVLVYIDGENADVKSSNAANIIGGKIDMTFDIVD